MGRKKPDAFGLYYMHGNLREWCNDRHQPYYYAESPRDNPPGPAAFAIVLHCRSRDPVFESLPDGETWYVRTGPSPEAIQEHANTRVMDSRFQ